MRSSEQLCTIEQFDRDLLDQVLLVEEESFEEYERYPRSLFEWFLRQNSIFHVAKCEGEVVGYVLAIVKEATCHIISIAVKRAWRGRGLGERLMRRSLEECKSRGSSIAVLEVSTDNIPAINLYKKLGFKVKKVLKGYYRGRKDAYYMVKDLTRGLDP